MKNGKKGRLEYQNQCILLDGALNEKNRRSVKLTDRETVRMCVVDC